MNELQQDAGVAAHAEEQRDAAPDGDYNVIYTVETLAQELTS
jgi:hypothetical protein